MQLDPQAIAAGLRLVAYDSLGSTNAEALQLARAGEPGPVWVTARRQTAGRGRRGRSWHSPPGNMYASLLLVDPSPPECAPQLSFVAALALHDAVCCGLAQTPAERLRFKWPNDLLLDGAKVAGILVEGEALAGRRLAVVIGIGANCVNHPDDTSYPAADLRSRGIDVTAEALFAALSRTMQTRLGQWDDGRNFSAVRADWLARAAPAGEPIFVRYGDERIEGRFQAIDAGGRLVLALADGTTRAFSAGEVGRPEFEMRSAQAAGAVP